MRIARALTAGGSGELIFELREGGAVATGLAGAGGLATVTLRRPSTDRDTPELPGLAAVLDEAAACVTLLLPPVYTLALLPADGAKHGTIVGNVRVRVTSSDIRYFGPFERDIFAPENPVGATLPDPVPIPTPTGHTLHVAISMAEAATESDFLAGTMSDTTRVTVPIFTTPPRVFIYVGVPDGAPNITGITTGGIDVLMAWQRLADNVTVNGAALKVWRTRVNQGVLASGLEYVVELGDTMVALPGDTRPRVGAAPAGVYAAVLPGDLGFSAGGVSSEFFTGEFVKSPARRGNVLVLTHQRPDGSEVLQRFIGAERQPIAGLRRLAYIPSGETPAESHFLVTSKSNSSTSEIMSTDGISGVIGHHLAVWYTGALPEFDLFTPADTLRNFRTAFGPPVPLTIDGVAGYYHVTASTTRSAIPHTLTPYYYIESRAGTVIQPFYTAWNFQLPFTEADFLDTRRGRAFYDATRIGFSSAFSYPLYAAISPTLPVTDPATYTDVASGITWNRALTVSGRQIPVSFSTTTWVGEQWVLIAIPAELGALTGAGFINAGDIGTEFVRDSAQDITIDSVPYTVYRSSALVPETRRNSLLSLSQEYPRNDTARFAGFAVPDDGPDIVGMGISQGFYFWTHTRVAGAITINGREFKLYAKSTPSFIIRGNVLIPQFGPDQL